MANGTTVQGIFRVGSGLGFGCGLAKNNAGKQDLLASQDLLACVVELQWRAQYQRAGRTAAVQL